MTDTRNYATTKAALADLWQRVHDSAPADDWPTVTKLTTGSALARVPEGFSAWSIGDWDDLSNQSADDATAAGRHIIIMPTLSDEAPISIHRRLIARAVALGTGRCPLCNAVAGLTQSPPEVGVQGIAAWRVLPVYVQISHSVGCPANSFGEEDRCWFLPPTGTAGTTSIRGAPELESGDLCR